MRSFLSASWSTTRRAFRISAMAFDHLVDLRRMHEHALDFRGLVGAPHPALDAHVGAAARADARRPRRTDRRWRNGSTDIRVHNVVTTTSPTSPSATGSPVPGRRISTMTPSSTISPRHRFGFVGDQSQVRGAVALPHIDAARLEPVAHRRQQGFAGHHALSSGSRHRPSVRRLSRGGSSGTKACRHSHSVSDRRWPRPAIRSGRCRPGIPRNRSPARPGPSSNPPA